MNSAKLFRLGLAGVASAVLMSSAAFAETQLRSITAWPHSLAQVKEVYFAFQDAVTKASNGEITFQNLGPEAAPTFEQFEPLSSGVFDINYGSIAYHQSSTGLASAMALLTDMEKVRSTGMLDWLNDYYGKKFGVEILAMVKSSQGTFVLLDPVKDGVSLEGRKIRSNALYEGAVRAVGAVPVSMAPAEAYAAMEKGTLDGVAWPMHATAEWKLNEVGHYMTQGFGASGDIIMINKAKMDSLSPELQKIIRDTAHDFERDSKYYVDAVVENNKIMAEAGVKQSLFSDEAIAKIDAAFAEGLITTSMASQPKDVEAFLAKGRELGVIE